MGKKPVVQSAVDYVDAIMRGEKPPALPEPPMEAENNEANPEQGKVVHLPMWDDDQRGAPAAVVRSALFGMVKRGSRKAVENQLLASWKGTEIRYSGFRLDQADQDCWHQVLHINRTFPLGTGVRFTARGFLRDIHRSNTGNAHRWLRRSIGRMQACGVNIRLPNGVEYQGPLILEFYCDESSGRYVVVVNPKLVKLFDKAFVKLNMERRKLLRTDFARWLQGYIQSHRATERNPHRVKIERLRDLSGSETKELRKFRQQLKTALNEHYATGTLKRFTFRSKGLVVEWART